MMKAILAKGAVLFCLLSALLLPTLAAANSDQDDFIPRQPTLVQPNHREWTWDGTDRLAVAVPATVRYTRDGQARIVITGPETLLAQVSVGQGQIRCDDRPCHFGNQKLDVTVSGVALHNVTVAGSGDVLLGRLNQDKLNLSIAGSGSISAEGQVGQIELVIAGSGNAKLGTVAVQRANIQIAGSGNAMLTPREDANVSITGSGNVEMKTRPGKLNQAIIGSGSVHISNAN